MIVSKTHLRRIIKSILLEGEREDFSFKYGPAEWLKDLDKPAGFDYYSDVFYNCENFYKSFEKYMYMYDKYSLKKADFESDLSRFSGKILMLADDVKQNDITRDPITLNWKDENSKQAKKHPSHGDDRGFWISTYSTVVDDKFGIYQIKGFNAIQLFPDTIYDYKIEMIRIDKPGETLNIQIHELMDRILNVRSIQTKTGSIAYNTMNKIGNLYEKLVSMNPDLEEDPRGPLAYPKNPVLHALVMISIPDSKLFDTIGVLY